MTERSSKGGHAGAADSDEDFKYAEDNVNFEN